MKIYRNSNAPQRGNFVVTVAPAAHLASDGVPAAWLNEDGTPKSMTVTFVNGVAEVENNLAKYLISQGIAKKTNLMLPLGFKAA